MLEEIKKGKVLKKRIIAMSVSASILLTGCSVAQMQENLSKNAGKVGGTAIGVAGGAAIGHKIAGKEGAIAGALIGGIFGYIIGESIDDRRANIEKIAAAENIEVHFEDIKDNSGEKIGQSFITEDDNQFATGSAVLRPKAKRYFQAMARQYSKTDQKVLIMGHTDDIGSDSSNFKLSEKRAMAVAQVFKDAGLTDDKVYIYGLGESKPIASNKTHKGRAQNRRVEIVEAPSEADIAKYAYLKPTNTKLLNKEKMGAYKKKNTKPEMRKPKETVLDGEKLASALPKMKADESGMGLGDNNSSDNKSNRGAGRKSGEANKKSGIGGKGGELNEAASTDKASSGKKGNQNSGSSGGGSGVGLGGMSPTYLTYGNVKPFGSPDSGECKNDYQYSMKNVKEPLFNDGKKFNSQVSNGDILKVAGVPINKESFSIVPKAYAGTSTETFANSCLQDSFKEKGVIKNYGSGRAVLIDEGVKQIPWIDGTMWAAQSNDTIISLSPIGVSVENVQPSSCPGVAVAKAGIKEPIYGSSTKVVTRQGDKGFIYRVYPTVSNKNSKFECIDIAFSDKRSDSAIGAIYYMKNNQYYKKDLTFTRYTEVKNEKKGLFSW